MDGRRRGASSALRYNRLRTAHIRDSAAPLLRTIIPLFASMYTFPFSVASGLVKVFPPFVKPLPHR